MKRLSENIVIAIAGLLLTAVPLRSHAFRVITDVPDDYTLFCQDGYRYVAGSWQPYSPPSDIPRLLFRNFPEIYSDTAYAAPGYTVVFRCLFAKSGKRYRESEIEPLLKHHVDSGMVRWESGSACGADSSNVSVTPRDDCFRRLSLVQVDSLVSRLAAGSGVTVGNGSVLSLQYYLPDGETAPVVRVVLNGTPLE